MLATLFNIPADRKSIEAFSFANADHHFQIFQAVQAQYNVDLPYYILDPMPLGNLGVWLYNHQNMHDEQNAVLGIQGQDYTDLDFSKPDQVAAWIYQHANEHRLAAEKLGL